MLKLYLAIENTLYLCIKDKINNERVIGYIRVSTDNQDLERQRVLIRKYCENKGYSLLRIEEDYAISGTVSNRNGLNSILNITNSVADMVVVSELSRLSRQDDIFETLTQIHTIIRNVDLVILDEPDKVYEAGKLSFFLTFNACNQSLWSSG